jgi:hypothetical protein
LSSSHPRIPSLLIPSIVEIGASLKVVIHTSPVSILMAGSRTSRATGLPLRIESATAERIVAKTSAVSTKTATCSPSSLRLRRTIATAAASSIPAAIKATATPRPKAAAAIAEATSAGIEASPAWIEAILAAIAFHGMRRRRRSSSLQLFPG